MFTCHVLVSYDLPHIGGMLTDLLGDSWQVRSYLIGLL